MKYRTQWLAALTVAASASAGLAFGPGSGPYGPYGSTGAYGGFGPYTRNVTCLEPVSERVLVRETCPMEPRSSIDWGSPFRFVGRVVSAPFVAVGNALSPAPVGERYTTWHSSTLMPVGERITTTRVIRTHRMLVPVGERVQTVKIYRSSRLMPVGERITTIRTHRMLAPVGERVRTVKVYHSSRLMPVGERISTTRIIKYHRVLEPVGERTYIRTTRTLSYPSYFCD